MSERRVGGRKRCLNAVAQSHQGNTIGVGIINELKFPEDKKKTGEGAAKD